MRFLLLLFALQGLAPGISRASCQNSIRFYSREFVFIAHEIAAYRLSNDAVGDSIHETHEREMWHRLALGLSHAIQIHRCEVAQAQLAAVRSKGSEPVVLYEGALLHGRERGLVRRGKGGREIAADSVMQSVRRCITDSLATLYAVEIVRFPPGTDPRRSLTTLAGLTFPNWGIRDSTAVVDWVHDACWGWSRWRLYFLPANNPAATEIPLYYGLFVEEGQASAAADRIRIRYGMTPGRVVPVRLTGSVLKAILGGLELVGLEKL